MSIVELSPHELSLRNGVDGRAGGTGAYKNAVTEIEMLKRGYLAAKVYRDRRESVIAKSLLYCSRGVYCAHDVVEQKIEEENCI